MRRRDFVTLLGGAAVAWPRAARAQAPNSRPLIGYLAGGRQAAVASLVRAFQDGLQELGYVEGRDLEIVYRFAEGRPERLAALAEELTRLNPRLILAGAVDA